MMASLKLSAILIVIYYISICIHYSWATSGSNSSSMSSTNSTEMSEGESMIMNKICSKEDLPEDTIHAFDNCTDIFPEYRVSKLVLIELIFNHLNP